MVVRKGRGVGTGRGGGGGEKAVGGGDEEGLLILMIVGVWEDVSSYGLEIHDGLIR